jgi:hypothetical protein
MSYVPPSPVNKEIIMQLNAHDTADILKSLIQEDRTEVRLYRGRVQNMTYALAVASFAISAFLIGKIPHMAADQLRAITLLTDLGLISVMVIYFWRLKVDLVFLRKAMKARQDLLSNLKDRTKQDINPFPTGEDVPPDIRDRDLYWVIGLPVAVILIKMLVLVLGAASFVGT